MSDEKDNGGPAFPFEYDADNASNRVPHTGMTLRDYFAAKAMQGWLATFCERDMVFPSGQNADAIARCSYMMADAMLKARNS